MACSFLSMALCLTLGAAPDNLAPRSSLPMQPPAYQHGQIPAAQPMPDDFGPGPVPDAHGDVSGISTQPPLAAYSAIRSGEEMYPFDAQEPWMHGYFQEIPSYGGYRYFRPYNYKHVLSQSQVAGGWGLSPTMPYSQQFWRRYHARATMQDGALPAPPEWDLSAPPPAHEGDDSSREMAPPAPRD